MRAWPSMFDCPARMKTLSGFASTPTVASSTDVRKAAVDFMVVDTASFGDDAGLPRKRQGRWLYNFGDVSTEE